MSERWQDGPWKAEKQHSYTTLWRVVWRVEPFERVIADKLDEPTARLIAAAAEMLKSLESVQWDTRGRCSGCDSPAHIGHIEACLIGKALAKARPPIERPGEKA